MQKTKLFLIVLIISFPFHRILSQEKDCISVSQQTQVLQNSLKSIFKCDIYYNKEKDAVITHHYYPVEFVKMSNRFGEMKLYFPESNTVTIQQNQTFATTNELLYYFINNNVSDLGLAKEGFTLISTSREEGMMVTRWQSPPSLPVIDNIKIVFKEMLPIYAEYKAKDGSVIKKYFYSNYSDFKSFKLPMRITEISYKSQADSTITLSVFSDVRTGGFPDNNYFNFKIPDNARITK